MSQNPEYWWVNHKQTFKQEVEGNYLWSPTRKSDGSKNHFYENMLQIKQGDFVFSFASGLIQAVGVCSGRAVSAAKPDEFGALGQDWQNEGWAVPVKFSPITHPLRPKDHMSSIAVTLPTKYSPIQKSGNGNQGAYLAHVPNEMATVLIELLGDDWSLFESGLKPFTDEQKLVDTEADHRAERAIQNRTDMGPTERSQLVTARRGQGLYRKNLQEFEKRCRVTGVSELMHLRASHIKPWRLSSDTEKLDGNNGLLLSPHVDHLFDRGFISFSNGGKLLISEKMESLTLARWNIADNQDCGEIRPAQLPYLEFHRELFGFLSD